MSGSDINKIKQSAIEGLTKALGRKLFAIFLTGSASQNSFKTGWSDIDLLVVVDGLDFDAKRSISEIVNYLEKSSSVHHGLNVIDKNELYGPYMPRISLDGKVLQAMIDLKKYPERLIYARENIDVGSVYSPNDVVMKEFSLDNVGIFIRRNRQTLTKTPVDSDDKLKELLKKEIRAALIVTKLSVQHFTNTSQDAYNDAIAQAQVIFPDFDFGALKGAMEVVNSWGTITDREQILTVFRQIDSFLEGFSEYVFRLAEQGRR